MEDNLKFAGKWKTTKKNHMEDDLKLWVEWKTTKRIQMEDDLNFFLQMVDGLNFFQWKTNSKKIIEPKTIKSYCNGCGNAPDNLVSITEQV